MTEIEPNNSEIPEVNPDIIHLNDDILLMMPSGNSKLIRAKDENVSLGKFGQFQMSALVGQYYHRTYEITRDGIKPIDLNVSSMQWDETPTDANNQFIVDQEALGQKLSQSIIQTIVKNNTTFDQKTTFSKQKYIARKEKKPTAKVLCEYWFDKNPEKTRYLRIDTLSQMLTAVNVKANCRLLCVDDTGGLLALALVERMGGMGELFCFHDRLQADLDLLRKSNIPEAHLSIVKTVPWYNLDGVIEVCTSTDPLTITRSQAKAVRMTALFSSLHKGEFEGIIVASKFDPKEIIQKLTPFLASSSPIIVYSPHKEALLSCYNHIRYSPEYTLTSLNESWLREYQPPVGLAGTHPTMMMSGCGGFYFKCLLVRANDIGIIKGLRVKKAKVDCEIQADANGSSDGLVKKTIEAIASEYIQEEVASED